MNESSFLSRELNLCLPGLNLYVNLILKCVRDSLLHRHHAAFGSKHFKSFLTQMLACNVNKAVGFNTIIRHVRKIRHFY